MKENVITISYYLAVKLTKFKLNAPLEKNKFTVLEVMLEHLPLKDHHLRCYSTYLSKKKQVLDNTIKNTLFQITCRI